MPNIYQFREASGEIAVNGIPKESPYRKFNREYIESLTNGYVDAINKLIEHVNSSETIDEKTKNKILVLMTSLVLDNSDVLELKKSSKIKSFSSLIPNMTEIEYINDVPFDLDITERIFKYIAKILQGTDILEAVGLVEISIDNYRDFNEVFSSRIIGVENNVELIQDICYFNKKNSLIRNRLLDLATKGAKVDKKSEIKIRREYKFDPDSQSFKKRNKPIAKKVYELLAEKYLKAYDSLYSSIK